MSQGLWTETKYIRETYFGHLNYQKKKISYKSHCRTPPKLLGKEMLSLSIRIMEFCYLEASGVEIWALAHKRERGKRWHNGTKRIARMHLLMGLMVCSLCPVVVYFETVVGCSRCEHLLDSPATNEHISRRKKQVLAANI